MSDGLTRFRLLAVTNRLFTVFNNLTQSTLGEQILLLEFKIRVTADLRSFIKDDGSMLLTEEFEETRFMEYESILSKYRLESSWGKLKVLWIQLSK